MHWYYSAPANAKFSPAQHAGARSLCIAVHRRSQNVVGGVTGDRHPRRHYEVQEVVCTPVVPQGETLVKVSLVKVYSSFIDGENATGMTRMSLMENALKTLTHVPTKLRGAR